MAWSPIEFFLSGMHASDDDIDRRLRDVAVACKAQRAVLLVCYRGHISRSLIKVFSCAPHNKHENDDEASRAVATNLVSHVLPPLSDRGFLQRVLLYPLGDSESKVFPELEHDCRIRDRLFKGIWESESRARPLLPTDTPSITICDVFTTEHDEDLVSRVLLIGTDVRVPPRAKMRREDPPWIAKPPGFDDQADDPVSAGSAVDELALAICASLPIAMQRAMVRERNPADTDSFTLSLELEGATQQKLKISLSKQVLPDFASKTNADVMMFLVLRSNPDDKAIFDQVVSDEIYARNESDQRPAIHQLISSGSIQFCLRKKRPLMVNLSGVSREYYSHSAREVARALGKQLEDLAGYVSIPFRLREVVRSDEVGIGLLFAAKWRGVFSATDFSQLSDYSHFLADAMADALIFAAMESLGDVTETVDYDAAAYDNLLNSIAGPLLTNLRTVLGYDSATIRVLNLHGSRKPTLDRIFAIPGNNLDDEHRRIEIDEPFVTTTVARTGRPIYWADMLKPDTNGGHGETTGIHPKNVRDSRSEICVPLRIGNRLIGVINLESRYPNAFARSRRLVDTIARTIGERYSKEINSRNERLIARALLNSSTKKHFLDHCVDFYTKVEDMKNSGELPQQFHEHVQRLKNSLTMIERSAAFETRPGAEEGSIMLDLAIEECSLSNNPSTSYRAINLQYEASETKAPFPLIARAAIEIFRALLERCSQHGFEQAMRVSVTWSWTRATFGGRDFACIKFRNLLEHSLSQTEVATLYKEPLLRKDRYHWGCYIDGQAARSLGGTISCEQLSGPELVTMIQLPIIRATQ